MLRANAFASFHLNPLPYYWYLVSRTLFDKMFQVGCSESSANLSTLHYLSTYDTENLFEMCTYSRYDTNLA